MPDGSVTTTAYPNCELLYCHEIQHCAMNKTDGFQYKNYYPRETTQPPGNLVTETSQPFLDVQG